MSDAAPKSAGVLLIRADASTRFGVGHVMRCVALAQEWQLVGGQVVFAISRVPPALTELLLSEGIRVEMLAGSAGSRADRMETAALARRSGASWVVLDGYHFPPDFGAFIQAGGHHVLRIDDGGGGAPDADVILNQNLNAGEDLYQDRIGRRRLLLGARYTLLRQDIRRQRPAAPSSRGRRVLISMGGADASNLTERVFRAVTACCSGDVAVTVLIGAANDRGDAVRKAAAAMPGDVQVRDNETRVGTWLSWADTVVAAAGSTAWEIAYMGLPSLLLITAENQRPVALELARSGAALAVTAVPFAADLLSRNLVQLLNNHQLRLQLSSRGRGIVDGFGAHRVVAALTSAPVVLRPAQPSDCRMIWEWANETAVRRASFTRSLIAWDDHTHWFADAIAHPDHLFFIGEDPAGVPVGQARFAVEGPEATISVSVAADRRRTGLGTALIDAASRQAFVLTDVSRIRALIRIENQRSRHAFERAGYGAARTVAHAGAATLELVRTRKQNNA